MSRIVIELALRRYYKGDADPQASALRLLAQYDADRRADALTEAAVVAEGAVSLFEDSDECAAAAGAMEGLAVRFRRMAGEKDSRTADATPGTTPSHEARLAQLLDTIRTHGGKWSTRAVQDIRRTTGGPAQRGTARRDLAELHRRGHLLQHGAGDGRFYTLRTRKGGV